MCQSTINKNLESLIYNSRWTDLSNNRDKCLGRQLFFEANTKYQNT